MIAGLFFMNNRELTRFFRVLPVFIAGKPIPVIVTAPAAFLWTAF
jgi:hypothetical protein